jgi:hypothetical protein
MKLWGSVKQQAGKLAFEAEKAVRIKREESAISGFKSQIDAQCTEIGKVVLGLYREGTISHPQIEPFVQQVAHLQEQIKATEAKLADIQAEEFAGEGATAPEAPPPPATEVPDVTAQDE